MPYFFVPHHDQKKSLLQIVQFIATLLIDHFKLEEEQSC